MRGRVEQERGLEARTLERALWQGGEGWEARGEVREREGPRLGTQSARRGQRLEAALITEGTPGPVSTCSFVPFLSPPRSARPWRWAWNRQSAPSPLGPHLWLGGGAPLGAERGRNRRAPPRGWSAGPPLAGCGAGRRGGCHASRALGNLGLKATPSGGGGGGSSSALRPPARGGVCERSPPPPPQGCRRRVPHPPAPGARRPPPPSTAHTAPGRSPLPPRPRAPLDPHPPLPPNLSQPRCLQRKEEIMGV